MTAPLYLIKCFVNNQALRHFAYEQGAMKGEIDEGYLMHSLMKALWLEEAPRPFFCGETRNRPTLGGFSNSFLAYSRHSIQQLRELSDPEHRPLINWVTSRCCEMPTYREGQTVNFMVRTIPTERLKGLKGERDPFREAQRRGEEMPSRDALYRTWLELRLQGAATPAAKLARFEIRRFEYNRVFRKGGLKVDGTRESYRVTCPDIVVHGGLQVGNAEAFAALLARGVGRHRAFGYGMLLLQA